MPQASLQLVFRTTALTSQSPNYSMLLPFVAQWWVGLCKFWWFFYEELANQVLVSNKCIDSMGQDYKLLPVVCDFCVRTNSGALWRMQVNHRLWRQTKTDEHCHHVKRSFPMGRDLE